MKEGRIILADDNRSVLNALRMLLVNEFGQIDEVSNPALLPGKLEQSEYDVVLLDMNFRAGQNTGEEGLFWIREIKQHFPSVEVVILTAYGDVELAVNALKEGAADFVLKPWENEKLVATLKAALRQRKSNLCIHDLTLKQSAIKKESNRDEKIVPGSSPAMQKVMDLVRRVAVTDANILLTGENGTGKEIIAREIHRLSRRANEMFVTVDLVSLTETLFESELFGHKKGSFTNAYDDRIGKFALAHQGTLFLDEIGNLPMHLQSKLLTVIQNRIITPVGSNKEMPIEIRLICATNKNINAMVVSNLFREDLLYRINTIHIELPPLRERIEDIGDLTLYFMNHYCRKYGKPGIKISNPALDVLRKYPWPGNIRELQHAIEKAVILCNTDKLTPVDFQLYPANTESSLPPKSLEEMERQMITHAIKNNSGNMSITADELGVTRQTLYNKLKKYGL